jgi:tetratricopeptide (TPR) repeat protein
MSKGCSSSGLSPGRNGDVPVSSQSNEVAGEEEISRIIESARRAIERRDWLEASRCWDAVRACSPHHAPAYIGAGEALREAGCYDEAERVLDAGAERFPDNECIAIARARLANARRDWSVALMRWEDVRARFPDNLWGCLGHIYALRGAGRPDQVRTLLAAAEAALAVARQRGLDPVAAFQVEFEIAKTRLDWPAVRQSAEKIIASEATPSARIFLGLAHACWHLGDRGLADRVALQAISADPSLAEPVLIRAWVATDRGDGETALSCYRKLVEISPGTVRWSLKLVQMLNWLGRVKEAMSEIENVRRRWPTDPMVRIFLRNYGPASALAPGSARNQSRSAEGDPDRVDEDELKAVAGKAPGHEELRRPLLVADPARDILLAESPGAETAVLVFTAKDDAVSLPLPMFDRYLAALGLTAVYLKDFKRLRFLHGIQSLSENYAGTLAALAGVLSRLGVKRLCTIGSCDGGFAAIRYGVELCSDRILAFGATTYSPRVPLTRIEQGGNFMRNRLAANVSGDMIDLKPFLEGRSYGAQIELFYIEEDLRERSHALHLSGLRGISLHPQQGPGNHKLLRRLALLNEDFLGMLGKLLGVDPAGCG